MPRRPSGRYILPIAKKRLPTEFRTINSLLSQYKQAAIQWASCNMQMDTGTLPPLNDRETLELTPDQLARRQEIERERLLLAIQTARSERELSRALRNQLQNEAGLQRLGMTIAGGLALTVFGLPALGIATEGVALGAVATVGESLAAQGITGGLLAGGALAAGTVSLAADGSAGAGGGIMPRVAGSAERASGNFNPPTFPRFNSPCGRQ